MARFVLKCVVLALAGVLANAGCDAHRRETVYQNATIDALLDGNYDGETSIGRLKQKGDFGIGTFEKLDGEMLALDGVFYQMKSNGRVVAIGDNVKTPFAAVTLFRPLMQSQVAAADTYEKFQKDLDNYHPGLGRAYAIRVHGSFKSVKVRSVPAQAPPYRRLVEVVKEQSVFEFKNVSGTLVGFWFPQSLRHVNVPGYHFHFITDDKTAGGHVLNLSIESGVAAVQEIRTIELELEKTPPVIRGDENKSDDLHKVEK